MTIWENCHLRIYMKGSEFWVYYKHTDVDRRFTLEQILRSIQYEGVDLNDSLTDSIHISVVYIRKSIGWEASFK